jgi:hypothetical protein
MATRMDSKPSYQKGSVWFGPPVRSDKLRREWFGAPGRLYDAVLFGLLVVSALAYFLA